MELERAKGRMMLPTRVRQRTLSTRPWERRFKRYGGLPWTIIGDLTKFPHIEVRLHDADDIDLVIGGNGQPGLLRIQVFLMYA